MGTCWPRLEPRAPSHDLRLWLETGRSGARERNERAAPILEVRGLPQTKKSEKTEHRDTPSVCETATMDMDVRQPRDSESARLLDLGKSPLRCCFGWCPGVALGLIPRDAHEGSATEAMLLSRAAGGATAAATTSVRVWRRILPSPLVAFRWPAGLPSFRHVR